MADELYDLPQKEKKKEIKQIFQLIKDLHNTCSQRSWNPSPCFQQNRGR